jgi:hypothetical protein
MRIHVVFELVYLFSSNNQRWALDLYQQEFTMLIVAMRN